MYDRRVQKKEIAFGRRCENIVKFVKKSKDNKKSMDPHPSTVIVNKAQREKSREAVRHVLSWLSKTFPKAFDIEGAIRPLKIGILQDILAYAEQNGGLPFSKGKLRKALVVFTRRMEYLTCVKMRDTRIDLYGNEIEPVSEEGAKLAIQRIKKTIEKTIHSRRKTTGPRADRPPYRGPQKRRFSQQSSGHHNPYHEPRDREYYHHHDSDAQPSAATIKVKRRYIPKTYESNPYSTPPREKNYNVEKNYNSESYNTEASTVDRLKEKLGLKRRRERFDSEN